MSETIARLAQTNARNAMQRVQDIEQAIPGIVDATNRALTQIREQLSEAVEVMDALVKMLGVDVVADEVAKARVARAEASDQARKERLAKEVAEGHLVPAQAIGEKSLVLFTETTPEGKVLAGRAEFNFSALQPEFREKLLGKGVGATLDTPNKHVFTVNEVFDRVDSPPSVAVPAEASAPATEVKTETAAQ